MRTNYSSIVVLLLCACLLGTNKFNLAKAQTPTIKNDVFWYTKDSRPINSQGGSIFKFTDPTTREKKYYWYGVHYQEADTYGNNLTAPVRAIVGNHNRAASI